MIKRGVYVSARVTCPNRRRYKMVHESRTCVATARISSQIEEIRGEIHEIVNIVDKFSSGNSSATCSVLESLDVISPWTSDSGNREYEEKEGRYLWKIPFQRFPMKGNYYGGLPLAVFIKSICNPLVLQSWSKRRSGNDRVARYASAENDANYSIMRVVGMRKRRDTERGKKRKLMRTFEVQR